MPKLSLPVHPAHPRLLVQTLEQRDPEVFDHCLRVGHFAGLIGERLGLPSNQCRMLELAGRLHDIGKLAIPHFLVHKQGVFNPQEYLILQYHAALGGAILEEHHQPLELVGAARHHHERWDGRGYPYGLKGGEIPLFAQIAAVADAYDAMVSGRSYRSMLTHDEALDEIQRCRGGQFSPSVVEAFVAAEFCGLTSQAG
jgi:putative nucleotidyltransferase with HDIG domain